MFPMNRPLALLAALWLLLSTAIPAGVAVAEDSQPATPEAAAAPTESSPKAKKGNPYPLTTCPVSGEPLGAMGDPVVIEYEGREIRFCCPSCEAPFKEDPTSFLIKINEQLIEQQKPTYPLETCVVSGEKLGGMGEPFDYVHDNRLVRFCCRACVAEFQSDPAQYFEQIDQAVIEAQRADYPLATCIVSGETLGDHGEPVDYVLGTQLIRLCCPACVAELEKNPAKYLKQLRPDEEGTEATEPAEGAETMEGSAGA